MSLLPMIGLTAESDWWAIAYYIGIVGLDVRVYRNKLILEES
jgi:hypothetical protein